MGLVGAVRGRAWVTTTQPQPDAARPADLVARAFTNEAQSAVGLGLHLRRHVARLCLGGVRDRPCSPGGLSAGWRRRRCAPSWPWMPWSKRSTTAATTTRATRSITAIAARSICRFATPSGWPTLAWSRRSAARAIRMTTPRGVVDWLVQDGGDSATRPVAESRGCGIRHVRVGRLVQHAALARVGRLHLAGGVRGALLSAGCTGPTHIIRSPGIPVRFSMPTRWGGRSPRFSRIWSTVWWIPALSLLRTSVIPAL